MALVLILIIGMATPARAADRVLVLYDSAGSYGGLERTKKNKVVRDGWPGCYLHLEVNT